MVSLNGVDIQPLVDAGVVLQYTHGAPVSMRLEVVQESYQYYPKSWEFRETGTSVVLASGDNTTFLSTGQSHTVVFSNATAGYTGDYEIVVEGKYGWYASWIINFYTTDANGLETLRLNTEGPPRAYSSTLTVPLENNYYASSTTPPTKESLSSMVTTSPGYTLESIIQSGLITLNQVIQMFTTAQDYQLLASP